MESPARQVSLVPPPDRRQSETALAIARGTARLLRSLGFSCVSELPLPSGRRADLVALNERGEIWIVEIKSSIEDLRADGASATGADPQADDGAVRDRRRAADQSAGRSAGPRGVLGQRYRGARLAKMRCRVRRCMFSRRAVSETLRLHIS